MSAILERTFRKSGGARSQNQRLAEIFQSRPGEWLEMIWLGKEIGAWAVHSRVSYLRRHREMNIECNVERDEENGLRQFAKYRFLPKEFAGQPAISLPQGSAD